MMEIVDLINQKKIECITKKGYEPKFVYLGEEEMEALLSWAKDTFGHGIKYKADNGINFLELKCLEVKTKNHLNIV